MGLVKTILGSITLINSLELLVLYTSSLSKTIYSGSLKKLITPDIPPVIPMAETPDPADAELLNLFAPLTS